MALSKNQTDTWLTFEHNFGGCGGKFETRVSMLKDFPERVVCPGCPAVENQERTRVLQEFGYAADKFLELKVILERDYNLKLISGVI